MATLLTPEPPKQTLSTTLASILVLVPALVASYGSYKASTHDTDAGYKTLVATTVALQAEVLKLHDGQVVLQERNAILQDKVDLQGKQLDRLLSDLKVADEDGVQVESVKVPSPPMPAPPPPHAYEPKAPPATLQQAVQEQEKL